MENKIINFCTLFDSRYLSRGLALYESLREHCDDFHIYFFAFDDKCCEILGQMQLEKATVISLREFEDKDLLAIKPTRSRMEYCWTCTPTIIRYALDTYNLESCTYIDADLYFFSSPEPLLSELGNKSVIITEHRYTQCYDQSKKAGKYCVQFMTFKNNTEGKKVLNWWREACNRWCYARRENGRFGDQKYLDDWLERFEAVHVLQHLGGGVAPWNVQQYDVFERGEKLFGWGKNSGIEFEIIFYHFHHLKFYINGRLDLGGYRLSENTKSLIYKPYIRHIERIENKLSNIDSFVCISGETLQLFNDWKTLPRYIKHRLLANVLDKGEFIAG